jgi:hypothetical protein
MTTEALAVAGVSVDVDNGARWREEPDTVPLGSKTTPPRDFSMDGFGDAATRKIAAECHAEVVECA